MVDLPLGSGHVCLDASPLIHFADSGDLAWLGTWFQPRAFTAEVITRLELPKGQKNHPAIADILALPWLIAVPVDIEEDVAFVAELLGLWGSEAGKDNGEAEVVALCRRFGWTAILDDRRGRDAAFRAKVPFIGTPALIVAATAGTHQDDNESWDLYRRICWRMDRPPIPPNDDNSPAFKRAVKAVRRIIARDDRLQWPEVLRDPRVEKLTRRASSG